MKKITRFNIRTANIPQIGINRQYSIGGEAGAEFILQVFNSDQEFYDFKSRSFSSTYTSTSALKVKMSGDIYRNNIDFPANGSGDTYSFLLLPWPGKDTELDLGKAKSSYSFSIIQDANTTLTFTVATANTSNYTSWSSGDNITSTGAPKVETLVTKKLDWTLTNAATDGGGFGLRLIRQPVDTDWYFQTTEAISSNPAGDATSNNTVIVADLTDIATGMELIYHKGTTAPSATTVITAINQSTKTITFSTSTAFEDGETMTLRAKGSSVIQKAIGADIDFSNFASTTISAAAAELTKTVRTTASSTTIPLVGTYGVSGGDFVTISGRGIKNTSANGVASVTAGATDGSVVMLVAQDVKIGTKIYFTGSTKSIDIDNTFIIKSHPSANKTIYLNLDNFITPGVAN